jgi:ParB family transcriptional regulator, chromosome partitioning protein
VRELESRARGVGAAPASRARRAHPSATLHPDQEAAIAQIEDSLGAALGAEVEVTAANGGRYRARLEFESLDEAMALARRLGIRAAA